MTVFRSPLRPVFGKVLRGPFANPTGSIVYASSTASGAGDGTSWDDAYTTLNAALEAADSGDTVYSDSTETAPFAAGGAPNIKDGVAWVSNRGANGETWISGATNGTWTDEGSGVFSIADATEPYQVAYDFKRDDTSGTVTGVDLTQTKFAAALTNWGVSASDCVAWYGFLEKEATATTTPAEGKWSYDTGRIYINPPGTPTLATVNSKAIYGKASWGIFLANASGSFLNGFRHSGRLIVHFTPGLDGAEGYSVRSSVAQSCSISDVIGIASGNHMVGLSGDSGTGNSIRNCIATGGSKSSNPYLFRSSTAYPNAGHVGNSLVYIVHPYLKTDGVPLASDWQDFSGNIAYSHGAGGANVLGGVTWTRLLQIDAMQQIADKQSTTLNASLGRFVNGGDLPTIDPDDTSSFPIVCRNSLALGPHGGPSANVRYVNTEFDCMGGTQAVFSFGTSGGPWYVRIEDCTWRLDLGSGGQIGGIQDDTGRVDFVDSVIDITDSAAQPLIGLGLTTTQELVKLEGTEFTSPGSGPVAVQVRLQNDNDWIAGGIITSQGGNTFGEFVAPVKSSDGEVFGKSEWQQNVDSAGLDTFTAPEQVTDFSGGDLSQWTNVSFATFEVQGGGIRFIADGNNDEARLSADLVSGVSYVCEIDITTVTDGLAILDSANASLFSKTTTGVDSFTFTSNGALLKFRETGATNLADFTINSLSIKREV